MITIVKISKTEYQVTQIAEVDENITQYVLRQRLKSGSLSKIEKCLYRSNVLGENVWTLWGRKYPQRLETPPTITHIHLEKCN